MKKDRNAFFSEYGFSGTNQQAMMMGNPSMNPWGPASMPAMPGMPGGMQPGPGSMPGMPGSGAGNMPMPTDVDSRISKLEREIRRLEARVSKLEGDFQSPMPLNEDYGYSSMYMV